MEHVEFLKGLKDKLIKMEAPQDLLDSVQKNIEDALFLKDIEEQFGLVNPESIKEKTNG